MLSALFAFVFLSHYARFAAGEEIYGINGNYTSPAITRDTTACGGEGWVGDGQIGFRQSFSGIRLQMYFVTGPDGAIGNIFLDNNRVGYIRTFDAQSNPSACVEVMYDTGTLLQGSHVVDVYNAGKDPDSTVVNATLRFHKAVITGPQDISNPASITGVRPTTIATKPLPSTFLSASPSFSVVDSTSSASIGTPSSFNLFTFTTSPSSSLSSSTTADAGAATQSVTPSSSKKSSTGVVVGGIVGGLAFLSFLAFLYFVHRRRRGKKPEEVPAFAEAYTVPGGPANQINFSVGPAVQPEIQSSNNNPATTFNPYNPYHKPVVQPGQPGGFASSGVGFGYAPSTQPTSFGVISPSSTDLSSSNNASDEKSAAAMAHRPSPPIARNSSGVPLMSDLAPSQRAASSQLSRQQMEVVQSLLARGVSGSAIDAVINGMVEENQQGAGSSMARSNSFMAPPPEYRPAQ